MASAGGRAQAVARTSVIGGRAASISEFPFLVALFDPRAGSPAAGFFCGGVILDARHVVTAAHCVGEGAGAGASARVAVLAGSTTLAPQPGAVTDGVQASSLDARYEPATSDFDVAVLTLDRPLWAGAAPVANGVSRIAPLTADGAAAASAGDPNVRPPVTAIAAGWGDLNPAPSARPAYPTGLRAVSLPLVSDSLCEAQYAAIEQTITPRMICAGGGRSGLDTCYGDSGGPLLADGDRPARPPGDYVLIGLVDFGNGCAQSGYAGVYTRIASPPIARFVASFGAERRARPASSRTRHRRRRHRRHR